MRFLAAMERATEIALNNWSRLLVAVPHHPRGVAAAVQVLKVLPLLKRVHTGPESVVSKGKKFAFCNQPAKGFFHQFVAIRHILENLAPEDKESAVDPCPGLRNPLDALYDAFSVDWSRRWPAEEIWVAAKPR